MGLNDEREKLRQAVAWLGDSDLPVTDEKFKAAWEHVTYVYRTTEDCELRSQAKALIEGVMGEDWLN